MLKDNDIKISMTGKGRQHGNAYVERLWRSFKYEGSYLYNWKSASELKQNIPLWIRWYNCERPHQALKYKTPSEKYYEYVDKSKDLTTNSQYQQHNNDLDCVVV